MVGRWVWFEFKSSWAGPGAKMRDLAEGCDTDLVRLTLAGNAHFPEPKTRPFLVRLRFACCTIMPIHSRYHSVSHQHTCTNCRHVLKTPQGLMSHIRQTPACRKAYRDRYPLLVTSSGTTQTSNSPSISWEDSRQADSHAQCDASSQNLGEHVQSDLR